MSERQHSPLCDTRLGPEFEVREGEVLMTLHICVGFECLDSDDHARITPPPAASSSPHKESS